MQQSASLKRSLNALRTRLDYVMRAWTVDNYEALMRFYVHVMPQLVEAERCGVFVLDAVRQRILSKAGTGLREGEIEAPLEGSVVGQVVSTGQAMLENNMMQNPGFHQEAAVQTGFVTHSMICAPICSLAGGHVIGALQVLNKQGGAGFDERDAATVAEVGEYLAMALDNIVLNEEIVELSGALEREVSSFQSNYLGDRPFIAESSAMRAVLETVRMVGATPVNVVLQGDNGTGKEVIARMIHEARHADSAPFVAVNCAAIPENLMESEFFGYEKGAFTGAAGARKGRFEEARGGTLFLDEVADLPLNMQPKFLRAIQEQEGSRLGSNDIIKYDVRIISACNRSLRAQVEAGQFREDLFYRLYAVEISIPPLRDRRDDIVPLAMGFLSDVCRRFNKTVPGFEPELLRQFEEFAWPGNVRQLLREVERLVALAPEGQLLSAYLSSADLRTTHSEARGEPLAPMRFADLPEQVHALEIALIRGALEAAGGTKSRAAKALGITRQGLHKKMKRYQFD
jgi:transcriptional regulator with GAF, ATPase, and Fis domain